MFGLQVTHKELGTNRAVRLQQDPRSTTPQDNDTSNDNATTTTTTTATAITTATNDDTNHNHTYYKWLPFGQG